MAIALAVSGVAFAAFCVWLTVRIVNRRERWAKWTLAAMIVGLPALYVAGFGPAIWLHVRLGAPEWSKAIIESVYEPLIWMVEHGPQGISEAYQKYGRWWIDLAEEA